LKGDLNSPSRFRNRLYDYIAEVKEDILNHYNVEFSFEEIGDLLISVCRSNDFGVMRYQNDKMFLDEEKFWRWVDKKLIPNTITVSLGDEDVVRLLIFCIEITYQMFGGGTKATITQKGFRQRRRTFESILVDQFVGKLGEIFVKKFLEKNYSARVELD